MDSQSSCQSESQTLPADCFKILLATDIHLGYKEKDVIIGNDSFITFEEILSHAKQQQVDFILLGGDLFHDTNPSKEALNRCLELLRRYTLGDAPINFEIQSDHEVNYDDPNTNIAIPVFSIHGNHDDPSGYGGLSSMDILSTSGLLNYFGRWDDLSHVKISPIFMTKGTSQIALCGLSHIHDNRLARLFLDTKVTLDKPDEQSGDWFNILALHQNRIDRGPKNYIPEKILPDFLDFILWGHEHDCRVVPEENPIKGFFVSQPGSSVATSLSEGEAIDKHIAVLYVCRREDKHAFRLDPIKLQTVRPFIFKQINLQEYEEELDLDEGDVRPKVKKLLTGIIHEMIEEAKKKETGNKFQPKKPLIRLRVTYQNEDYALNEIRFGQQFNELVANPSEVLKMSRNIKRTKVEKKPIDEDAMNNAFDQNDNQEDDIRLENYVDRYFNDPNNTEKLQVLFASSLTDACRRLAENHDEDAANKIIEFSMKKACDFLNEKMPEDNDIDDALAEFQLTGEEVFKEIQKTISSRKATSSAGHVRFTLNGQDDDDADDDSNNRSNEKENQPSSSSRGTRGGRTTRGKATARIATSGRASTRGNSRAAAGPSARNGLDTSSSRSQQPTIQQAMSRRSTRPTKEIVYDL